MDQRKAPLFSIDLTRCTGCKACSVACKDRAGLPDEVDWLRVEACEGGTYPTPTLVYRVVHCFHCADPACVASCPTGAMAQDVDGWVQVDASLCIACGACVEACPFEAVVMGAEGATKCDGCTDEIARGWGPTCVRACPMRALDADGARQRPGRVIDEGFQDHGIRPSVVYWQRAQ